MMGLGHFIRLGSKETMSLQGYISRHRSNLEKAPSDLRWDNFSIKKNNVHLNYELK